MRNRLIRITLVGLSLLASTATATEPTLRSNLGAQEFAAALRGRWESAFTLPGRTNISHAEFRADDTATVVVTDGTAVRTNTGPYRLEFERPPADNMVTLAKVTIRAAAGDCVLTQVSFGQHNGVQHDRILLRIDGNPHGALDRFRAADPVPLVTTLTDPSATWEARCRAEDDLAKCSAPETLAALMLHGCLKMPDGPICNGSDRETDHKLNTPVKWEIFYATHRAWEVQIRKLTAAERQTVWPNLLRQATTATAKVNVFQELANHWVPAAQPEVAKLLDDPKQEFPVRRSAGFCLALHAAKEFHDPLVALLEDAPAAERRPWFDLLADPRHRRAAGLDPRVVRVGFALLEEERRRSPDSIHGAYFLALTLGSYVGAPRDFQPDTGKVDDAFFTRTVQNAQRWWALNCRQYEAAPPGNP